MERETRRFRRAKPRKKVLKFTITIGAILFLLTSGFGAYTFMKAKNAYDQSQVDLNREGDKSDLREAKLIFNDPFSILLLGIENYSSGNKSGLADTQIVLTIDPVASGTRNEDLLIDPELQPLVWGIRRVMANMNNTERAATALVKGLQATRTNEEFLIRSAKKAQQQDFTL